MGPYSLAYYDLLASFDDYEQSWLNESIKWTSENNRLTSQMVVSNFKREELYKHVAELEAYNEDLERNK